MLEKGQDRDVNVLLLIWGIVALIAVMTVYVPIRRDPLTGTAFFIGWLTGELAGQLVVLDVLVVALLVWGGAGNSATGVIGLCLAAVALVGLLIALVVGRQARRVVRRSLASTPGLRIDMTATDTHPKWGRWWRVVRAVPLPTRAISVTKDVPYVVDGAKAQRLDVYAPAGGISGAPVMIYVHGGAWVLGDKREQGKPMLFELVERGWVCFSINYRLSPRAVWPDHINDVLAAIAWVKEHAAEYGGDPSFVALSGGSAGGHLAALAALAGDDDAFKAGFEGADCSVDACIPIYGVLDMTGDPQTSGRYGPGLKILLERQVIKQRVAEAREVFEAASPSYRLREDAPPFLVLHGTHDTLVPVAVPRAFVPALREVSSSPVGYIEFPLAQHAFDVIASPRCSAAVAGIVAFLDTVRSRHEAERKGGALATQAPESDVQSGSCDRETERR